MTGSPPPTAPLGPTDMRMTRVGLGARAIGGAWWKLAWSGGHRAHAARLP